MAVKAKAERGKRTAADTSDSLFEWTKGKLAPDRALVEMLIPSNAILAEWETLQRTGCYDQLIVATIRTACAFHESTNGGSYYSGSELTVVWQRGDFDFWVVDGKEEVPFGRTPDRDPDYPAARIAKLVRHLLSIPLPAGAEESEPTTNDANRTNGESKDVANGSKPKKTKPVKKHSEASAAQSMEVVIGSIVVPEGLNPRKNFDQESLARLAESIKVDGLIQPLAVRKMDDGKRRYFELLAGERRLRAAKIAKLKTVPVTIRSIDDAAAARIRLAENYFREDLDPIEEAAAFQALIDEHGFTQRELADYWGLSQGKIGNAVRLLKLPEEWQQRVISREITPTMGRDLASWVEFPRVLDSVAKDLNDDRKFDPESRVTSDELERIVRGAAREESRPLSGTLWDDKLHRSVPICLTPKEKKREDLQVREVDSWNGKEKRAFNVELWEELQAAGLERRAARGKDDPKAESGSRKADAPKLSPAEQKRKAEQKKQQHAARLRSYYLGWLQVKVLDYLDDRVGSIEPHVWLRIVMYFASSTAGGTSGQIAATNRREEELAAIIKKHGGKVLKGGGGARMFESLSSIPNKEDFRFVLIEICRAWVAHPFEPAWQCDLQPEVLTTLAGEFGITLESHWKLDRAFLELHNKAQLAALAKEWGTLSHVDKRSEFINFLMLHNEQLIEDDQVDLKAPKALLKVAK